MGEIMLKKLN